LETFLFLFDAHTGGLAAIMEVLYYDWLKTAAVAAVATDYLAPKDAEVVALFGTGRHAQTQLHGLCAVRPIRRVQAFSRRPGLREAFCSRMSDELEVEVVGVDTAEAALAGADIVTTITTSPEPVFDGEDLPLGPVHINAMGAHYPWVREIDDHVVLNSRIILDEWHQGLEEHGEILQPMQRGLLTENDIDGDLGSVITGRIPGREDNMDWTLFLSGGTGVEDVAVGTRLVEHARAQGIGTEFEFNQPYEFEL
jgi:ornithine cyclodeaminase